MERTELSSVTRSFVGSYLPLPFRPLLDLKDYFPRASFEEKIFLVASTAASAFLLLAIYYMHFVVTGHLGLGYSLVNVVPLSSVSPYSYSLLLLSNIVEYMVYVWSLLAFPIAIYSLILEVIKTLLEKGVLWINGIDETTKSFGRLTFLFIKNFRTRECQIDRIESFSSPFLKVLDLYRVNIDWVGRFSCPSLKSLVLRDSQINQIENFSLPPLLEELDLRSSQVPQIENLFCSPSREGSFENTRIRSLFPFLKRVFLRGIGITQIPNFSDSLERLEIPENLISEIRSFSFPNLEVLDLSGNRLSVIQGLSCPNLKALDLSRNRLSVIQGLSCPNLKALYLFGNQITEIPDSILSLPRDCQVNLEGNSLSPEYIASFQALLDNWRLQHPGQGPNISFSIHDSLSHEIEDWEPVLRCWKEEIQGVVSGFTFSFTNLLSLNKNSKENLAIYFSRLRNIPDYRERPTQNRIIHEVSSVLNLMEEDELFRTDAIHLISGGLETCGDRVLIVWIELNIYRKAVPLGREELKELALGHGKFTVLMKYAKKEHEERGGDEIARILHYLLGLKRDLTLPIEAKKMLYQGLSGVDSRMLTKAKGFVEKKSEIELLSFSAIWLTHQRKTFPEAVQAIEEKFGEYVEQINQGHYSEGLRGILKKYEGSRNSVSKINYISQQRDLEIAGL